MNLAMLKSKAPNGFTELNGEIVPYSAHDDSNLFTDLPEEHQEMCLRWIKYMILPRKTVNKNADSYNLKHRLEKSIGIYMSNNQFKHAMLLCGFYPINES